MPERFLLNGNLSMTNVNAFYREHILPALKHLLGNATEARVMKAPTSSDDMVLELNTSNLPKQVMMTIFTHLRRICSQIGADVRRRKGGRRIIVEFQTA